MQIKRATAGRETTGPPSFELAEPHLAGHPHYSSLCNLKTEISRITDVLYYHRFLIFFDIFRYFWMPDERLRPPQFKDQ